MRTLRKSTTQPIMMLRLLAEAALLRMQRMAQHLLNALQAAVRVLCRCCWRPSQILLSALLMSMRGY